MHRFRKKQDLRNVDLNTPTTNESQISNNTTGSISLELPSLPPASDFRTSLILPTLTKRFSVLRRGSNNNDTKRTSLTQEAPSEIKDFNKTTTTNQVSKIKSGRSPLTPNEESLSALSTSNNVNFNNSNNNVNNNNNNDNNNDNNQQVLSNARKFYDPSFKIQNTANVSSANNDGDENGNNVKGKDFNHKNDKNEIINQGINVKSLRRTSSDGLLVNPTKDRFKPPRIRPPSTVQVPSWKNEFTTFPKNNYVTSSQLLLPNPQSLSPRQVSPTKNSPRGLSPRMTNFDSNEQDSFPQPSSPRSPLDKLSEGFYNIKVQSSPNLSPSSSLYNTQNLSQTSFGGSSTNEEEEMRLPIQKSPSINSLRNIDHENIYSSDRASTTSTIGSSLKRIGTLKTTISNISSSSIKSSNSNNSNINSNNNNGSIYNEGDNEGVEGDDEAENGNIRDSNGTGIMYLKNTLPDNDANIQSEIQPESSALSMPNITDLSNSTTDLQKKPSRGRRTPPPKPQPPPLSLTDTLIASGQSDIAHQVMVMRRAQNVNQQRHLQPQNKSNTRQSTFKKWPKKNVVIKNISGPQLVSTSSNVKTIPIVQLDDDKFRRKRESETGIGKSLRRIKDVFTSDSESALFGKRRTSLVSSNENLSRKFVSDDNLNRRFLNSERSGLDFVKRRALSTRESDKPSNRLRQDIKNNFILTMNNDQQQLNRDDVYTSGNTPIISDKPGQQPLYDIYALKRHAEMVSRYSSNKKIDNPTITSRSSSQSSLSLTVDNPNESESVPSSPISPFSDYPSSTSTPPPISPRNPLRQPDKSLILYSTGSQNSISDTGSDDRDSKDSKASSSRLMSIFSNRSSKSSSSRNSKSSDTNHLQVSQTNIANDSQKSNKIIRRTIIITKPYLPPLPEDSAPSTPIFPSSSANSSSSSLINSKSALKKKKINPDDGKIHVASDGRQWFLSKNTSNDDENDNKIENGGDSSLLSIPTQKTSLNNRPPTPIPSPNTRENAMDLPYGIPIPPIPSPHRNSVASKTSKRTSKSSIASSLKSSSSKYNRKSVGSKSVYSTYGESIYDYYDYSDQEVADDEGDSNSNATKRQQLEAQQHIEVLEMSDGSYVWQVVNGLRSEDMEDRYSYYYAGANNDDDSDYSQIWPQDFGRLNYGRDLEDDQVSQLSLNDQQPNDNSHLDYYATNAPNSSQSSSKQKHGQYLTPDVISSRNTRENRLMNNTNSTISTSSSEEENSVPRTSVYFAKDVPLPKLLEEMTRGFGGIDSDREEIHYMYGGEVGAGGTGVVGEMTVEEKLDQVMRALGVDERL